MFLFELHGAEVAKGGVKSSAVVEGLDVLEEGGTGRLVVLEGGPVDQLLLEGGEEALHRSIVPAVRLAAHAGGDLSFDQGPPVLIAGVLDPSV